MSKTAIQSGIWLVGLGILFLMNWWWPGILILIGISMLVSVLLPAAEKPDIPPDAGKNEVPPESWQHEPIPPPLGEKEVSQPVVEPHTPEKLPESCPMCGGPVLSYLDELEWTGYDTAECPYCSTNLPLLETRVQSAEGADSE